MTTAYAPPLGTNTPVVSPPVAPPPTLPASGWYADPSGQPGHRYWDGGQWTDHRHAATVANSASSAAVEEQGTSGLVVGGYILAAIMPLIGFILGIVVATRPANAVSKHGIWIIVVSIVAFFFWIAVVSSGSTGSSY